MAVVAVNIEFNAKGEAVVSRMAGDLDKLGDKAKESKGLFDSMFEGVGVGVGVAAFDALTSAIGGALGALPAMVAGFMDAADALDDLSARTGLSKSELQEFGAVGAAVGLTAEDVATGVGKLQKALVEGSAKTAETLQALGLSMRELRDQSPSEQLGTVLEAIGQLEDPAERTAAAVALLGKSGAALVPLAQDFDAVKERLQALGLLMSAQALRAAADLSDAMGLLGATVQGAGNNFSAAVVTSEPLHAFIAGLTDIVGQLSIYIRDNADTIRAWVDGAVVFAAEALVRLVQGVAYVIDAWSGLKILLLAVSTQMELAGLAAIALWQAVSNPRNALQAFENLKQSVTDLSARSQRAVADEMAANGARQEKLRGVVGAFEQLRDKVAAAAGAQHGEAGAAREGAAAHKLAGDAVKKHAEELRKLLGPSIADAQEEMQRLSDAFVEQSKAGELSFTQLLHVQRQMDALQARSAAVTPELQRVNAELEKIGEALAAAGGPMQDPADLYLADVSAEQYSSMAEGVTELYNAAHDAINETVERQRELNREWREGAMAALSSLSSTLFEAAAAMRELGTASGQTASNVMSVAGGIAGIASAWQAGQGRSWSTMTDSQRMQAGAGAASAGMDIYSQSRQNNDDMSRTMAGAAQGAMAGAAFGPWGVVIGAIAGGALAYFSGPEWSHASEVAGEVFGQEVSDELAQAIYETSQQFGISERSASLLHLADMMEESGRAANTYGAQGAALISEIAHGTVPLVQGLQAAGQAFGRMAAEAEAAGRVGDFAMRQMIQASRLTGQEIPEITQYVQQQIQGAIQGAAGMLAVAPGTEQSARDQATIWSATFWAAVEELGVVAAADAMRESFGTLRQNMSAVMSEDAVNALLAPMERLINLTNENEPFRAAVQGAEALRQNFEGLANSDYMLLDTFQATQRQAGEMFNAMIAGGADTGTAFQAIAPLLQSLQSGAAQFGYELDSNTQSLIAQAQQNGIAFRTDPQERMVTVLEAIAEALGAHIPDAADAMAAAVEVASGTGSDAIDRVGVTSDATALDLRNTWAMAADDVSLAVDAMAVASSAQFDAVAAAADTMANDIVTQVAGLSGLAVTIPVTYGGAGGPVVVPPGEPGYNPRHAATGAIVSGPELIVAGEGGATEVVAPVAAMLRHIGEGLAAQGGGGAQVVHIVVKLDERQVGEAFYDMSRTGRARVSPEAVY